MTFNDMLIPAVGSASLDEEPMRSCDCIHFPTVAGVLWHVVAEMPFEAASFNLSHERACDEDLQREVFGTC